MATDPLARLRRFALLAATIAVACIDQTNVSPSAAAIVVHAVLNASTRDQYVIVQTTNGAVASQRAVSGASVAIIAPDGRVLAATEEHDSTFYPVRSGEPRLSAYYHISLDRYGASFVAGSTYQLHITLPDGREVTGSTMMPASTPGASLNLPATLARAESLNLEWPRVAGASAYSVAISSARLTFELFADTTIVLPGTTKTSDGTDAFVPGAVRVVVSAVDANYYDYYRRGSDVLTGAGPISRLNGAVGVFGSIAPLGGGTVMVR